jgi:hypothetical protein
MMADDILQGFFYPGQQSQTLSPQQVKQKLQQGQTLQQQATDSSPTDLTGAIARGLKGVVGGYDLNRANAGQTAGGQAQVNAYANAIDPTGGQPGAAPATSSSATQAIASLLAPQPDPQQQSLYSGGNLGALFGYPISGYR